MRDRDIVIHEFGDPGLPLLVLVHGLTEAGTAWPDAVRRWSRDWHILALDQRGHGVSPRFTTDELRSMPEIWVRDLSEALCAADEPAIVVGHSLGGFVATLAALSEPQLFRGIVLEDPALGSGQEAPPGFVEDQLRFLSTFDQGTAPEKARMREESAWTDDEIDAWADCKPLVDRRMIEHLDLENTPAAGALGALTMRTLVLYDADGPLAIDPAAVASPLVQVEHVAGVGHCIRRDDPETYHRLVDAWLARIL